MTGKLFYYKIIKEYDIEQNYIYQGFAHLINANLLTDPFTPGKLKNTSGPDLFGICFKTFINFFN